ncbi:hypothetical protein GRX03_04270 [Halovenus sp. WSH3]|uniref:Uncharacterized protein n=1 Tax=Halovenus carboxidivorans TaxID=2692199 RepID=A0A6B0T6H6_9EURY|nr:hypothetical protein [Halovenus carboxidivorans]MXR50821.1 hypothetical protein [Halovenus carboxidivorans]
MADDDVSVLTAAAVFLGAAVLVGAPVTALALGLVGAVLDAVGVSITLGTGIVDTLAALTIAVAVLWLWLQISYEAAQLQVYGTAALSRGPRWAVLVRHLLLSGAVLAVLVSVAILGVSGALVLVSGPSVAALPGLALAAATVAVLVRAGRAFRDRLGDGSHSG